nr:collagen alpha-1(II) chain-like [Manis javanica]
MLMLGHSQNRAVTKGDSTVKHGPSTYKDPGAHLCKDLLCDLGLGVIGSPTGPAQWGLRGWQSLVAVSPRAHRAVAVSVRSQPAAEGSRPHPHSRPSGSTCSVTGNKMLLTSQEEADTEQDSGQRLPHQGWAGTALSTRIGGHPPGSGSIMPPGSPEGVPVASCYPDLPTREPGLQSDGSPEPAEGSEHMPAKASKALAGLSTHPPKGPASHTPEKPVSRQPHQASSMLWVGKLRLQYATASPKAAAGRRLMKQVICNPGISAPGEAQSRDLGAGAKVRRPVLWKRHLEPPRSRRWTVPRGTPLRGSRSPGPREARAALTPDGAAGLASALGAPVDTHGHREPGRRQLCSSGDQLGSCRSSNPLRANRTHPGKLGPVPGERLRRRRFTPRGGAGLPRTAPRTWARGRPGPARQGPRAARPRQSPESRGPGRFYVPREGRRGPGNRYSPWAARPGRWPGGVALPRGAGRDCRACGPGAEPPHTWLRARGLGAAPDPPATGCGRCCAFRALRPRRFRVFAEGGAAGPGRRAAAQHRDGSAAEAGRSAPEPVNSQLRAFPTLFPWSGGPGV